MLTKLLSNISLVAETLLLLMFDCIQDLCGLSQYQCMPAIDPALAYMLILLHIVYEVCRTDMAVACSYGDHNS